MKIYRPIDYGKVVKCECGDESCYAGLVVYPNSLVVESDLSDVSESETIVLKLNEKCVLTHLVEVPDQVSDEELKLIMSAVRKAIKGGTSNEHTFTKDCLVHLRDRMQERLAAALELVSTYKKSSARHFEEATQQMGEANRLKRELAILQERYDSLLDELVAANKRNVEHGNDN